jgi:predicted aspartyl protease
VFILYNDICRGVTVRLTFLSIEIGNPANPGATRPVEFMVDSGAIYTVAPAEVLEDLGIQPLSEETFWLANGEKLVRKRGIG